MNRPVIATLGNLTLGGLLVSVIRDQGTVMVGGGAFAIVVPMTDVRPITLIEYLTGAANALSTAESARRVDLFVELRYRALPRAFPHDVFSVAQASLDFFDQALSHLAGAPFTGSDSDQSVYELNYRRWIRANRSAA